MIPPVSEGWMIVMLLIAFFAGGFIGVMALALFVSSREECDRQACTYVRFYRYIEHLRKNSLNDGKIEFGNLAWMQDRAKGYKSKGAA